MPIKRFLQIGVFVPSLVVSGLLVVGCGAAPSAPVAAETAAPTVSTASGAATVRSVAPAALTVSGTLQVVSVEGANFKEGLTVAVALPGREPLTFSGEQVRDLTPTSFQIEVTPESVGTYSLQVMNPAATASAAVSIPVQVPNGVRASLSSVAPSTITAGSAVQSLEISGQSFESGLKASLTSPGGTTRVLDGSSIVIGSSTMFRLLATLGDVGTYTLRVTNPSSQSSEPLSFAVKGADVPVETLRPTVTSTSPVSPGANSSSQVMIVRGTNFVNGLTATLTLPNGSLVPVPASSIVFDNSGLFRMTVTLATAGQYKVRPTNPSGLSSAEPFSFTVEPAESTVPRPTVTGTSPSSPTLSPTNQTVSISGTNFINGLTATLTLPSGDSVTVSGEALLFGSATSFQIIATLPTAGTYKIRATNAGGQSSEPWTFTVKGTDAPVESTKPTVTSTTPISPAASASSQVMIVRGTNFVSGLSATLTLPNGSLQAVPASAIVFDNSTLFRMTVTLSTPGLYKVRPTNPSGVSAAEPFSFNVESTVPRPTVTGTSPISPAASPTNQTVTISGTNFINGLSATLTLPSGATTTVSGAALLFGSSTSFQIIATLPTSGTYKIRATNAGGVASEPWTFTVEPEVGKPTVTSTSPVSPGASASSQVMIVRGTNFVNGLTAALTLPNGSLVTVPASSIVFDNSTLFRMTVTLATPGLYKVRPTNPSGQSAAEPFGFNVESTVPRPTITGTSPISPAASPTNQTVAVSGTNFINGMTATITLPSGATTTVSGAALLYGSSTSFQIIATLSTAGTYKIRATNDGGVASEPWTFTVEAAADPKPTVTSTTPVSPVAGAASQVVTVRGTNFVSGLSATLTMPNGSLVAVPASSIVFDNSTVFRMTVTLPTAGTYKVRPTNPSGQSAAEPFSFVVTASLVFLDF